MARIRPLERPRLDTPSWRKKVRREDGQQARHTAAYDVGFCPGVRFDERRIMPLFALADVADVSGRGVCQVVLARRSRDFPICCVGLGAGRMVGATLVPLR